jgi:hypothetical protein
VRKILVAILVVSFLSAPAFAGSDGSFGTRGGGNEIELDVLLTYSALVTDLCMYDMSDPERPPLSMEAYHSICDTDKIDFFIVGDRGNQASAYFSNRFRKNVVPQEFPPSLSIGNLEPRKVGIVGSYWEKLEQWQKEEFLLSSLLTYPEIPQMLRPFWDSLSRFSGSLSFSWMETRNADPIAGAELNSSSTRLHSDLKGLAADMKVIQSHYWENVPLEIRFDDLIAPGVKVQFTSKRLFIGENDGIFECLAVNDSVSHQILINRKRWDRIRDPLMRKALLFHEILGTAGFENTGDYYYSSSYYEFATDHL